MASPDSVIHVESSGVKSETYHFSKNLLLDGHFLEQMLPWHCQYRQALNVEGPLS
jgi:hypothetical protein